MSTNAALKRSVARPRLGFLGVGWIGRHRMEAIAKSGAAEVFAIADPVKDAAEQAAQAAGNPGCALLSSYDGLLDSGVDAVVIATPSAQHAEQSIRALQKGKAVFCQKPLGRDAEEVRRVVDASRRADRLLGVDFSYRYLHGMSDLRGLLQAGELGELYGVDLVFHNAYGPDKPWFYDPKLSGGGCVMDLGIHLVDLALWMLGPVKVTNVTSRLFARGKPLGDRRDTVEDYAVARMDLDTGTAVQLACSWKLPAGRDAVIEAVFYGTKGGAALRNVNGSFYDFTLERFRGTSREVLSSPPDAWGGKAAVAWAEKLASGATFDPESERLVEVAATLDWIYRA
ncbi:MAG TPA: Gfo/Idh/MocA family oxidoreductase [Myxococcaceae bacterium]|nr:Gfo/Idh/MocA family oxidoreductase [Myxococcaceae bacterium]